MNKKSQLPHITVSIPVHDGNDPKGVLECIESVVNQDYDTFETLVISESDHISDLIRERFKNVRVVDIENEDGGVSRARNEGYKNAEGDVVAYIDSDAIATESWLTEIGKCYRDMDVPAVGGKAEPIWLSDKQPLHIPNEFLWLVGATHSNHPKHGSVVRSTFGCNMSYKRSVLEQLGGFRENLGKERDYNLQGEEPELGARMRENMNAGMYYNENALVRHRVDPEQVRLRWLSERAYLQGISKSIMESEISTGLSEERGYLGEIMMSVFGYLGTAISGPNRFRSVVSAFMIFYYAFLVGMGYLNGRFRVS